MSQAILTSGGAVTSSGRGLRLIAAVMLVVAASGCSPYAKYRKEARNEVRPTETIRVAQAHPAQTDG